MTQATTGSLVRPFAYNANGDVTALAGLSGVTNTLTYDPFGRLSSHTRSGATTTYTVNALDQRMGKSNSGSSSRYVYAGYNQLLAEYTNGQWTSYIWNGSTPVAMVRNNQIYYIQTDHLGRPQLATDANRNIVWKASNFAFNRTVTLDAIGGLNLGYPGQYYDSEFGTWHNGYREYLADTGRYLQSDPIGLEGGINTFSYADGSPVVKTDPTGLATPPALPQGLVNFCAGAGDALLLSLGDEGREAFGVDGGVDVDSGAYTAGSVASMAIGLGRVAYAGIVKGVSIFAESGAAASSFRTQLRNFFRAGTAKNWRLPDLSRYTTDSALRAAAGRTNPLVNGYGVGVAAAGAAGATTCSCPMEK